MRRIWIDVAKIQGSEFEIADETFRHAIQVTRLREGEEFELVSGGSEAVRVRIVEIKKKSARVEVVGRRTLTVPPAPYIHLAVSIPKWATFDSIIEKSVELGVTSVQPILSDFGFIRKLNDFPVSRTDRLQKIARSATEQSGRGSLLQLKDPLELQTFVSGVNRDSHSVGLFAYEGASALDIRTELTRLKSHPFENIWVLVGSEGGFSHSEVRFLDEQGWPPVTMGSQILRVDTACFALVSVIKYELGLMK